MLNSNTQSKWNSKKQQFTRINVRASFELLQLLQTFLMKNRATIRTEIQWKNDWNDYILYMIGDTDSLSFSIYWYLQNIVWMSFSISYFYIYRLIYLKRIQNHFETINHFHLQGVASSAQPYVDCTVGYQ